MHSVPQLGPPRACVFDAYGTLFDFTTAVLRRASRIGPVAPALIETWRQKQLQYTWLRSMQRQYAGFEQVTADALDYALEVVGIDDAALRNELLGRFLTLDPYPDAVRALAAIRAEVSTGVQY